MKRSKMLLFLILIVVVVAMMTACGGDATDVEYTVTFMVDNQVYHTATVKSGYSVALPDEPTKSGYTFEGWCSDSNLSTLFNTTSITADITVYADWEEIVIADEAKTYIITFNSNGGNEIENVTCQEGKTIVMPADPTRGAYTFEGWYEDSSFTTPFIATVISEDIMVYAKWAEISATEGLLYTLNSNGTEYSVSGIGSATDSYIIIPNEYNGLAVTSIDSYAFKDASDITYIVIPKSVTSMGTDALDGCSSFSSLYFAGSIDDWCNISFESSFANPMYYAENFYMKDDNGDYYLVTNLEVVIPDSVTEINYTFSCFRFLTSVVIGNNVESIGSYAFANCTNLTSVVIGSSVTSISTSFVNCTSLTSIEVSADNANYKSIDGNLYSKDGTELMQYAIGKTDTEFTIPDSVTSIGDLAFGYCTSLTNVNIPDSVKNIGNQAFTNCTSLTSVTIPRSVENIGVLSFYGCTSLQTLTIGNANDTANDIYIDGYAFQFCTSLTDIYVYSNISTVYINDLFVNQPFSYAGSSGSTTNLIIGDNVTSIGSDVFYCFENLNTVTIGSSVESIGKEVFRNCYSLTSITFSDTSTWYATTSSSYSGGTEIDVSDSTNAATNLTSTYHSYYWYKV